MVTDQVVQSAQRRMGQWLSTDEFASEIERVRQSVGDLAIEASGYGFFRDAWVGHRCAAATHATMIRLGSDPPDIELSYGDGRQTRLEIVEVLRSGRRRGDEIRADRAKASAGLSTLRHIPGETWPSANEVLEALRFITEAKARKGYPSDTVLSVYLNVGDWDNQRQQIEAGIPDALSAALKAFNAIWLLWHGRFYVAEPSRGLRLGHEPAG